MRFSLVTATLGRTAELRRLLASLSAQNYRDFHLVIVDQNDDDRLTPVIQDFNDLDILRLTSARGLSRARNVGLAHCSGDVIAFPDDDCWYPPDLLSRVATLFEKDELLSALSVCSRSPEFGPTQGRWSSEPTIITPRSIWTCVTSYTMFLKADFVGSSRFDETLGVGSGTKWGAGEEVEFLLRLMNEKSVVAYRPELTVFHPEPVADINPATLARSQLYNRGFGRVLRLRKVPLSTVIYLVGRSFAGTIVSAVAGKWPLMRYRWIAATQRVTGYFDPL